VRPDGANDRNDSYHRTIQRHSALAGAFTPKKECACKSKPPPSWPAQHPYQRWPCRSLQSHQSSPIQSLRSLRGFELPIKRSMPAKKKTTVLKKLCARRAKLLHTIPTTQAGLIAYLEFVIEDHDIILSIGDDHPVLDFVHTVARPVRAGY